mgnify:CR=1 FL=1
MSESLKLVLLPGKYAIFQCPPSDGIPPVVFEQTFWSVTRSSQELSIIAPDKMTLERCKKEGDWQIFRIEGPLEFSEIGVIARLTKVLAESHISVFVVSTFDTDYVLIKSVNRAAALQALRAAHYDVSPGN